MEDCRANILVVEDMKLAKAIEPYRNQLPHLKKIIEPTGPMTNLITKNAPKKSHTESFFDWFKFTDFRFGCCT